jgi:hypothetical protein
MRLPVDPTSPGQNGKNLDMQVVIAGQMVGVEVKAPFRERPKEHFWYGDDSDKIAQATKSANEQFRDDRPNLLCLVPSLRSRMFAQRHDLLRAAYGQSVITWKPDFVGGEHEPPHAQFRPDGKFLNTRLPKGGLLKEDGFPRYRRISAIVCIEERRTWTYQMGVEHDVLVLHNPHAYHALPQETWAAFPQLVPVGDVMKWTDGVEVVV